MRSSGILVLAEMLNAECQSYKLEAAQLVASHVNVRTHCHDCACTQELPSRRCLLDSWHVIKHLCSKKLYDPAHPNNAKWVKGCNSEAAEQLWSRTDKLAPFATHLKRTSFRIFLKRYCAWRNQFNRCGMYAPDVSKLRSRKAAVRRGTFTKVTEVKKMMKAK